MGVNNVKIIFIINLLVILKCTTTNVNGYHLSDSEENLNDNGYTTYNSTEILHTDIEITSENIKGTSSEEKNDGEDIIVDKDTMDLITIIWYFSTFLALVAFFIVMACSDNHCRSQKPEEPAEPAPPTPAPSYREFAPPNYDSIMKKNKDRIFIIPVYNKSTINDIDIEAINSEPIEIVTTHQIEGTSSIPSSPPPPPPPPPPLPESSLLSSPSPPPPPPPSPSSSSASSLSSSSTTTTTTTTTSLSPSTTIEIQR